MKFRPRFFWATSAITQSIMAIQTVDRSRVQFWPYDRYHPRYDRDAFVRPDGASVLTGVMRDDGALPAGEVRLPEVPFRIVVPSSVDYKDVNIAVWRFLEVGVSNLDLDFTPASLRPAVGPNYSAGIGIALAIVLFGFACLAIDR